MHFPELPLWDLFRGVIALVQDDAEHFPKHFFIGLKMRSLLSPHHVDKFYESSSPEFLEAGC